MAKYTAESLAQRVVRSTVTWDAAGQTLLGFLASRFTYRSGEEWRKLIGNAVITLNGRSTAPETVLALHDQVEYHPGELPEPPAELHYRTVYEDPHLLVIDKPGNLSVHPSGPFFKHTLWHLLASKYGEIHLVNRLDRETSGLMLAAFDAGTAAALGRPEALRRKEYLALVHGSFPAGKSREYAGFLVPDTLSRVRKKRRFVPELPPGVKGESAVTQLVLEQAGRETSLVRAVPVTGRMHQIRATLYSLGYPLVGDKLYGVDEVCYLLQRSDELTDELRAKLILPRQALHSAVLEFRHSVTGEVMRFTAPEPPEFRALL